MLKILQKVSHLVLITLVFLMPLLFLPITSGFYDFNKNALLSLGVALLLLINPVIRSLLKKEVRIVTTPLDLPILLFALAFLASFALQTVNKKEVLLAPGGMGTIVALTLLYFSLTQSKIGKKLITPLIVSASLLSAISLFFFLEWWKAWGITLPDWLAQRFFSPTGGLLPQAMFLGVALVLIIIRLRSRFISSTRETSEVKSSETSEVEKTGVSAAPQWNTSLFYSLLAIVLLVAGLGVSVYQLFTTQKPSFLPYSQAWAIAVETFKNLRTALFGVGPTNFLVAFTQFRPFGFNTTAIWNLRFTSSSNWYFQILTELGILGLLSYLLIVYKVLRTKSVSVELRLALIAIFLVQLFLPSNYLLLFTLFVLLALYASQLPGQKEIVEESEILPWLVSTVIAVALVFGVLNYSRTYAAEMAFKRSLDALVENRGIDTYNLQIRALELAPYRTNYRLAYSQTNFALANALAGQENLTDQDRANISQLVQQAIREAKMAVNLNPQSVVAWENLAGLYQNLVNFAQGADQWALATYAQAIRMDPLNPQLRLSLGGIYYTLGNFDEAERIFRLAVDLKPDFANAHYNLASALREKGQFLPAAQEMQITLSLVEPNTNDFDKVTQELDDLRKKISLEAPEATAPAELETLSPPATPPAGIEPRLELGEEAEPEISPLPSPSPTVTPTP